MDQVWRNQPRVVVDLARFNNLTQAFLEYQILLLLLDKVLDKALHKFRFSSEFKILKVQIRPYNILNNLKIR